MAITSQTTSVEYVHGGVIVDYIINFMYFDNTAIKVYKIDLSNVQTELAVGSEWTLQTTAGGIALATGIKMPDTVRLANASVVPTTHTIKIVRVTASTQTSQPADKTIEVSLDKLTAQMQELKVDSSTVDDLKVLVDANTAEINLLKPRVTNTENDIASLQIEQVTQNNRLTAVESLKEDKSVVAVIEGRVTAVEADVVSVGNLASNAMAKANNNEADIAAIVVDTAQININKNNITTLQGQASALEAADVLHQAQLTNHEGRILDLESNLLDEVIHGTMDIVNNVSVPAWLTYEKPVGSGTRVPLQYDADETASVIVEFSIERQDDTTKQPANGHLYMVWRDQWYIEYGYMYGWDPSVDFTVVTDAPTKVGTVYYTSSNFTGANYSGTIRFKARRIAKGV